uniref:Uncharacterized protein n=1 Tax=Solanum tuberosum TaxID=4113 RepID=M1D1I4_SOLTU
MIGSKMLMDLITRTEDLVCNVMTVTRFLLLCASCPSSDKREMGNANECIGQMGSPPIRLVFLVGLSCLVYNNYVML